MKLHLSNLSSLILRNPARTLLALLVLFFNMQIKAQGTWTPVATTAPGLNGGVMILLSDGSVMCKSFSGGADGYGNLWNKLTPNSSGSYANGTWSTLAPMTNTRLYFSSQVLKDGRVYVAGGEYGTGLQQAETYNPLTNTWTPAPSPGQNISDANSEILEDGRVLQALVAGNLRINTMWNPATNTYSAAPTCLGIHNESAWIKLPDNSVLFVDRNATTSERYIPATNSWVNDATVPVSLYDPYGFETGGALLLPDGRAFFLGSLGHTAYYTPSGTSSPGTWAAGPDVPSGKGAPDAPMAMMVNGKILISVSPVPTSANHFPSPTTFYTFDYLTNTYTSILAPGGAASINVSCYVTNFLDLPDGNVLYGRQNSSQYYVFTPTGSPLTTGKPVINNITPINCTTFSITGTQFNGISQGTCYGDDWQMASNYPLVRLTSGSNVYYTRTSNWNSTGVKRGSLPDTAQFVLPAGLPAGTYNLVVVANGIASDPVSFTPGIAPVITGSTSFCTGSSTTLNAGSGYLNYLWSTGATTQSINVSTANIFTVIVTGTGGCTGSASVTTTVTTSLSPTISGSTSFCAGSSTNLNAGSGFASYLWSTGATIQTINVNTAGTFTVSVSNASGCTGSTSVATTVNASPVPTISGNTSFCTGGSTTLTASGGFATYNWSTGATTQSIVVNTANTYSVTVSNANGCTGSKSAVITISSNPAPVITGNTPFCDGSSIILDAGAGFSLYEWSSGETTQAISADAASAFAVTVTNGTGCTGTTSVTTIVNPLPSVSFTGLNSSYDVTAPAVTLTGSPSGGLFSGIGMSGNTFTPSTAGVGGPYTITYSYTDGNGCSNNFSQQTAVTNCTPPNTPGSITSIGGVAKMCPGDVKSYKINAVTNATSYTWTPPAGGVVTAGQGTVQVTVAYGAGFTAADYIKVTANNSCGSSAPKQLIINRNTPAIPSVITGSGTGVCNATGVPYSVTNVIGINYNWSFSVVGASIASGQGTNAVTADYTSGYITGSLIVTANNGCGASNQRKLTVKSAPETPASINGSTNVCPNQFGVPYSITPLTGAANYTWIAPTGSHVSDGINTSVAATLVTTATSVTVNYGSTSGALKVRGNTTCAKGAYKSINITVSCRDGIDLLSDNNNFNIYPNPNNGIFSIQFNSINDTKANLSLVNALGQTLSNEEWNLTTGENEKAFEMSENIPAGIYFIVVKMDEASYRQKVVKQ